MSTISKLSQRAGSVIAVVALIAAMGGTWMTASPAAASPTSLAATTHPASLASGSPAGAPPDGEHAGKKSTHKELTGKLNLNTATEDQLLLLPTVGPSKAERVVAWRKKNGGFKRIADLRRVKGFGYKTIKKLEPFLDIKGETTLAQK